MAFGIIFAISSELNTALSSHVMNELNAMATGSIKSFMTASILGASKTLKPRCSLGITQLPSSLTPYFFANASALSLNSVMIFLVFSLNIGQLSGECLSIIKNVGIQNTLRISIPLKPDKRLSTIWVWVCFLMLCLIVSAVWNWDFLRSVLDMVSVC